MTKDSHAVERLGGDLGVGYFLVDAPQLKELSDVRCQSDTPKQPQAQQGSCICGEQQVRPRGGDLGGGNAVA
ncbi:hypothetical protein [Paracoccus aestuariivivens]|uniref:Uncharacterized protein n=1 Tax=Paracoccus aestuariivivens TaxID=1820333 RepID=A0A6L6JB65_9RHOB|nr:hypothetical protein [Paracoccus aestuariivivens]MTH79453.1 hypothetical protein [Paracoccus aestuariivivens]